MLDIVKKAANYEGDFSLTESDWRKLIARLTAADALAVAVTQVEGALLLIFDENYVFVPDSSRAMMRATLRELKAAREQYQEAR